MILHSLYLHFLRCCWPSKYLDLVYERRMEHQWQLFLVRHSDNIRQWIKTHGEDKKLPVEWNGQAFLWMTREQRR